MPEKNTTQLESWLGFVNLDLKSIETVYLVPYKYVKLYFEWITKKTNKLEKYRNSKSIINLCIQCDAIRGTKRLGRA